MKRTFHWVTAFTVAASMTALAQQRGLALEPTTSGLTQGQSVTLQGCLQSGTAMTGGTTGSSTGSTGSTATGSTSTGSTGAAGSTSAAAGTQGATAQSGQAAGAGPHGRLREQCGWRHVHAARDRWWQRRSRTGMPVDGGAGR